MNRRITILFSLLLMTLSVWAQHTITGQIIDAKTGEPIPFASAQYLGHGVGVASDIDGNFQIARHNGWQLTFTSVGYVSKTINVNSGIKSNIKISLKTDNKMLKEVTIKTKRQRYSRKNNPAVEMMKKVLLLRNKPISAIATSISTTNTRRLPWR